MEIKHEKMHPDLWLKGIEPPSEQIGFKADEMVECGKCGRKNPPVRAACLYCGSELPLSEIREKYFKPNVRKLEEWEKGFSVIFLPPANKNEILPPEIVSEILQVEKEDVKPVSDTGKALPLVRLESAADAEMIVKKLAEKNIESTVLSDEELRLDSPPKRLRGIEFSDDKMIFILFNNDEIAEIRCEDLNVVVKGTIFERRIESSENLKRKESAKKTEIGETGFDEILMDIYSKNDKTGYRITASGFDYSCLGSEKQLLAKDNINKIAVKLRNIAPQIVFDDDYKNSRAALAKVWEVSEKNDSGGLGRTPLSGYKRLKTVIVGNLSQFNRYSRLQNFLVERKS